MFGICVQEKNPNSFCVKYYVGEEFYISNTFYNTHYIFHLIKSNTT